MFIDIYARSLYAATLHNDLPLRPLPPYQGLRLAQESPRPRVLLRLFRTLRSISWRDAPKPQACGNL